MIRSALLLLLVPVFVVSSALAQPSARVSSQVSTRGTSEDQKACQNDAVRLCRNALADDFAVLQCFQSQRPKLSAPCRQVLERYGQ